MNFTRSKHELARKTPGKKDAGREREIGHPRISTQQAIFVRDLVSSPVAELFRIRKKGCRKSGIMGTKYAEIELFIETATEKEFPNDSLRG